MKKQKTMLFIITLIVGIVVICFLAWFQDKTAYSPIALEIEIGEKTETIECWQQENDYYAFLPSYAQLRDVRIKLKTVEPIYIGGIKLEDGMTCEGLGFDVAYELFCQTNNSLEDSTITFVRSANVAAMHIDTQSGSMEFIHKEKGNKETGVMRLYTPGGTLNHAGDVASLSGRGNATWVDFEKKPYSLDLSADADLLGMGAAKRWILLANAGDASHLRNKTVYDFARDVGLAYSPDSQWVDLYLNGEYAGLYLLCERNEVQPQRVDIDPNSSFLVSLEIKDRLAAQKYPYVATQADQALRIHYPQELPAQTMTEIANTMQSIENAILSEDGIDPVTGKSWQELIDLDSWARKYLVEEIFASIDACFISQFFYKDGWAEDSLVFAGPVWDYDNAMGNRLCWELAIPETFHANQFRQRGNYSTPWFYHLYRKDAFYSRVKELYREEYLPILENNLKQKISAYTETISSAAAMNEIRWGIEPGTYKAEAEYVTDYVAQRQAFLSDVWCNNTQYCYIFADYGHDCCYAVLPGECFADVYIFEEQEYVTFLGWYYADTDEPFDPTKPITEDIEIYAKWQTKEQNKLKQILKLVPLGVIAMLGATLLLVEFRRIKKSR